MNTMELLNVDTLNIHNQDTLGCPIVIKMHTIISSQDTIFQDTLSRLQTCPQFMMALV